MYARFGDDDCPVAVDELTTIFAEAQALTEWQCRCEPRDGLAHVGVVQHRYDHGTWYRTVLPQHYPENIGAPAGPQLAHPKAPGGGRAGRVSAGIRVRERDTRIPPPWGHTRGRLENPFPIPPKGGGELN